MLYNKIKKHLARVCTYPDSPVEIQKVFRITGLFELSQVLQFHIISDMFDIPDFAVRIPDYLSLQQCGTTHSEKTVESHLLECTLCIIHSFECGLIMEEIEYVFYECAGKIILTGAPYLENVKGFPRIHLFNNKIVLLRNPDITYICAYESAVVDFLVIEYGFCLSCRDVCVLCLALDLFKDQMHLISDILVGSRIR